MRVASCLFVGAILLNSPALAESCQQGSANVMDVRFWSLRPIDGTNNRLTVIVRSKLSKPVILIDGQVGFDDPSGVEVGRYDIAQRTSIAALGTFSEMDVWGPFTFERLLKLPKSDVYAFVCVASVTYADGTTQQFE